MIKRWRVKSACRWVSLACTQPTSLPEVPPAQPEGLSERSNPQTIATPIPGNHYKE